MTSKSIIDINDHKDPIGITDLKGIHLNPLNNDPYSDTYKELATIWSKLPAYSKLNDIITAIKSHQLLFIVSGTGSGKTVLVPKMALHILNYNGKIAVTLPKRNITVSAATYAALTLDVELGKQVGYVHKGSDKSMINDSNRLVYMTDGTLIAKIVSDPYLTEFNTVIIDEAHERKVMIDLLLLFLKQILLSGKRPDLKVIIMSATIDTDKYQTYFSPIKSSLINISSKPNYEIETKFLDSPDHTYLKVGADLAEKLSSKQKDILFFITTSSEAVQLCQKFKPMPSVYCVEVYSEMPSKNEIYAKSRDAYLDLDPNYKMKLVMATNVAESSLTIDGLTYVIDSCYELYSYFDPETTGNILERRLITKAQAYQRRGRVGRTGPGICHHLLTKEEFQLLEDYPKPDILREDITTDVLRIAMSLPDKNFKSAIKLIDGMMDVPNQTYVNYAFELCSMYKLIDDTHILTRVGQIVTKFSSIPVNLVLFMIYSYQMFCAKEAAIIVAMIEVCSGRFDNLFYKKDSCEKTNDVAAIVPLIKKKSDHLTFLNIYSKFKEATDQKAFTSKYNLSGCRLRLDLLNKAGTLANNYYFRLVNTMKDAPQMSRVSDTEVKDRLIEALKQSHQHLTASKLQSIYAKKKQEADIQRSSVVGLTYKRKELAKKKFIYNELVSVNGKWEFSTVTLI